MEIWERVRKRQQVESCFETVGLRPRQMAPKELCCHAVVESNRAAGLAASQVAPLTRWGSYSR